MHTRPDDLKKDTVLFHVDEHIYQTILQFNRQPLYSMKCTWFFIHFIVNVCSVLKGITHTLHVEAYTIDKSHLYFSLDTTSVATSCNILVTHQLVLLSKGYYYSSFFSLNTQIRLIFFSTESLNTQTLYTHTSHTHTQSCM